MKYVKQFSIILGISFLAELLEILIPLPIAASVYGLVIMLVGLITKLIPLEKVETAADFLDYECYCCMVNLDEDEMYRFLSGTQQECPYFRLDDEYAVVRHQM